MKKLMSMLACVMAIVLCLTACGQTAANPTGGLSLATGGTLVLKVNPEIAVEYSENGTVTGVTARNDDALAIINSCTGLIGQPARDVVTDLVTAIGEAGYFVEEIEGQRRQITLEIEPGSSLPTGTFLDDVIADIRTAVSSHDWSTPLVVEGESDFGITDYVDTDYVDTDYGAGNDGYTDYNDTDYGPDNDGVTDYDRHRDNATDYGEGSDGVTDYDDTDYGPHNDGVTDYTDYGASGNQAPPATNPPASSGSTDYNDTNYGDSAYDDGTDYHG